MRKVAILCSALAVAGVLASSAFAAAPTKTAFSVTDVSATLTGVCSFDVAVSSDISGFEIDYTDQSGALTRAYIHNIEQDTFSANAKPIPHLHVRPGGAVRLDGLGHACVRLGTGRATRAAERNAVPERGKIGFRAASGGHVLAVSRCRQSGRRGGVLRRAVVTRGTVWDARACAPHSTFARRGVAV